MAERYCNFCNTANRGSSFRCCPISSDFGLIRRFRTIGAAEVTLRLLGDIAKIQLGGVFHRVARCADQRGIMLLITNDVDVPTTFTPTQLVAWNAQVKMSFDGQLKITDMMFHDLAFAATADTGIVVVDAASKQPWWQYLPFYALCAFIRDLDRDGFSQY